MTREVTNRLYDALAEGIITHEAVAEMALAYMSEDDVRDMVRVNDLASVLFEIDEDEEEEEDDPMDDYNYVGSPHHY